MEMSKIRSAKRMSGWFVSPKTLTSSGNAPTVAAILMKRIRLFAQSQGIWCFAARVSVMTKTSKAAPTAVKAIVGCFASVTKATSNGANSMAAPAMKVAILSAQTPDGGFIMVGTCNSLDKFVERNNGLYDGWVVRTDSLGNKIWWYNFGGEQFEYLYDVRALEGGNYLALGFAESIKADLLPTKKELGNDFWFFRFGDPGDDKDNALRSLPYLEGTVKSAADGAPIGSEIILTDNNTMATVKKIKNATSNGWYQMDLPMDGKFSVMFSTPGYMFYGQDLDYRLLAGGPELRIDPVLEPIKVGSKVILNLIVFETGSYDLKPESEPELRRLKYFLETNPKVKVEISGHTDATGNLSTKKELSERRAARVRDWLLKAGVWVAKCKQPVMALQSRSVTKKQKKDVPKTGA
jgi:outer membrane protein OmpA-like peptidoglycan-associated protein